MAEADHTVPFPGVSLEKCVCWDEYTGSAEALIAAGIITSAQVPGRPGNNKHSCTFFEGAPVAKGAHHIRDERYISIKRVPRGNLCVIKGVPDEEEKARRSKFLAAMHCEQNQKQVDEARIRAEACLRDMPATEDEFRRSEIRRLRRMFAVILVNRLEQHGYDWPEESLTALQMAFDAVVDAMMSADVSFDAARHEQIEIGYRRKIAQADAGFQRALEAMAQPSPQLLDGRTS